MAIDRRPRKRAASARPRTKTATRATRPSPASRRPGTRKSAAPRPARRKTRTPKKAATIPGDVSLAIAAALDKKAEKVHLLDLRDGAAFTDFFIICTGNNIRQVQAIADGVEESLKASGVRPALIEGYKRAEWILLDYFDFIVHIFTPATRDFYALEGLWGDAKHIEVSA